MRFGAETDYNLKKYPLIVSKLKDLANHGLVIKQHGNVLRRSKVHLLLCSGDIPAVAEMGHLGLHNSFYGCRICETDGKAPDFGSNSMYFENSVSPLRPIRDFKLGNPEKSICQPSIFVDLPSFSCSSFFGLDEPHLVARGIGKHIWGLITAANTKNTIFFSTNSDSTQSTEQYPSYISKNNLKKIGECIASDL